MLGIYCLTIVKEFFEGVERLLQNMSPADVSNNANYNKSSLKRTLKELNSKDIKRVIESLFKRVSKHFSEDSGESGTLTTGTVAMAVWKSLEDEFIRNTDRFAKIIAQCYPDTGLQLEYTTSDIESIFRKHRSGN